MELYSIGDEEETPGKVVLEDGKRVLHPAFLPSSLPIQHTPKGAQTAYLGPPLHYTLQLVQKPLFRRLISNSKVEWKPRVLKLQEEFLYAYERTDESWTLRGVWDLTRLITLEISKNDEISLLFPNISLNPADPLKTKTFKISSLPSFLDNLRAHLSKVNIDFDFKAIRSE